MTNGGAESAPRRVKADDFGRSMSRVAVAQICKNMGFQGFKDSAMDAFTDITIRYLCDLGKTASFYANLSGRTHCNIFDMVRGFEDIRASQGFSGASKSGNCLVSSGTVKEIMQFVSYNDEIPFAQPVPSFPVIRDKRLIPSFVDMEETPAGKHIPAWLPALPDPHTYVHTPMWNERVGDPRAEQIEQARQRRKAERALLSLQQKLTSNGSIEASSSGPDSDEVKEVGVVDNNANPFLSKPLKPVEKDISAVILPEKLQNHSAIMEAFGPAIEAAKEGGVNDDADRERKLLPGKRPAMNFRFKTRKKLLGESLDVSLSRKGEGRTGHWLGQDEERDDKKRRAEYILRQSLENPQELPQL